VISAAPLPGFPDFSDLYGMDRERAVFWRSRSLKSIDHIRRLLNIMAPRLQPADAFHLLSMPELSSRSGGRGDVLR